MAIANLQANAQRAQAVLAHAVRRIAASWPVSAAHSALGSALVTPPAGGLARIHVKSGGSAVFYTATNDTRTNDPSFKMLTLR